MTLIKCILAFMAIWILNFSIRAQTKIITVKADKPTAEVQPTMYGIFFEDINMGADGGIYAELIKNRSFEFYKPMMGWKILGSPQTEGDFLVENRKGANMANPRFLKIMLHNNKKGSIGLNNEGFRGIGIKKGLRYDFSLLYRRSGDPVKIYVELINAKGENIADTVLALTSTNGQWIKQTASFHSTATEERAGFNIWFHCSRKIPGKTGRAVCVPI